MAIIQCPDCNSNISDRAEMCPKCGYPIGKLKTVSIGESVNDFSHENHSISFFQRIHTMDFLKKERLLWLCLFVVNLAGFILIVLKNTKYANVLVALTFCIGLAAFISWLLSLVLIIRSLFDNRYVFTVIQILCFVIVLIGFVEGVKYAKYSYNDIKMGYSFENDSQSSTPKTNEQGIPDVKNG